MPDLYTIRRIEAQDLAYIGQTYVKNWTRAWLHSGEGEARNIPFRSFLEGTEARWRRWQAQASGIAAISTKEPDLILGWLVMEDFALHYIHVRKTVRHSGIARALMENVVLSQYTHRTPAWLGLLTALHRTMHYDPYRADLPPEFYDVRDASRAVAFEAQAGAATRET